MISKDERAEAGDFLCILEALVITFPERVPALIDKVEFFSKQFQNEKQANDDVVGSYSHWCMMHLSSILLHITGYKNSIV